MPRDDDPRTDRLFASPARNIEDFAFDADTASVFDDMLDCSVPFYGKIQRMVGELAGDFGADGTTTYDLGCSTANTMLAVAHHLPPGLDVKFVGIDASEEMLDKTRTKVASMGFPYAFELRPDDLDTDLSIENASVVVMSLTMQFVRPLHREQLLEQIYRGLNRNGCFILIEKILGHHSVFNRLYIRHYYELKKRRGYSDLEIAQKREALENILVPYRREENVRLMRDVGFSQIDTFFQWYNFLGLIGLKSTEAADSDLSA
ncbi:MAG: carboxy-S-adenosyl-L-methionine synthase CmoA [Vicinamibacterales bacterium]|jgi:tRNA (cmo5U34)-methyltransferase|nr:carboxy-S-adenosyl-L-methionine synthase CmoA [Acidobacteriota bacterium]MDP7295117.1 carboxy-S-adenosyl-L-methionine synthase CmoA [Vicinamibacterales bacterium]MDP7472251.1 carboxy-S-adenosyl-L-methionine synthase CmoA [Vicinamibacterales bacterium]MDP7670588.1 carboxy-S-adenosyl-L-methionine synthase CmoA [Vicinamibacterales bacterium]HJO39129.1 carboxy-S-adenosyl-L-methionine synthase CmoA [Vicinamibacterales bacterium]|tara:strand:+ start:4031 stop:4813 length:783 start_codon:yes stop_codon:yes gene_type:complete